MLHRDVFILETAGLAFGGVEIRGEPAGEGHAAGLRAGPGHARPAPQVAFDASAQLFDVDAHAGEQPHRDTVRLIEQAQQQVLAVDVGVAVPHRFGLGFVQRLLGFLGESVQVHVQPPELRLEFVDAGEEVEHDADRLVVQRQPGVQPADLGEPDELRLGEAAVAEFVDVRFQQAKRDQPGDQVRVQAGSGGERVRGQVGAAHQGVCHRLPLGLYDDTVASSSNSRRSASFSCGGTMILISA